MQWWVHDMTYSKASISLTLATLIACLTVMPSGFAMSVEGGSELEGLVLIDETGSTVEEAKKKAVKKAPAKKKAVAKKKAAPKKKATAKKKAAPKKKAAAKKKVAPKKKAAAKKKAAPKRKATKKEAAVKEAVKKAKRKAPAIKAGTNGATSLPEPSGFMLLLAGFFVIGALIRRQAKQP